MAREWYVASTKPASETLAERELRRQGFHPFNPRVRLHVPSRGDRTRLIIRPYLPGYILIRFDAMRDRWQSINGTRGVKRLFTQNEVPLRIRRGVVEELAKNCIDGFAVDEKRLDEIVYTAGDQVRLIKGSLSGFIGTVQYQADEKVRLILGVFGRQIPTTVPTSSVCPAVVN